MTPLIQYGLLALVILSAGAAIFVSVLISRRADLPAEARRAFLLSNLALIFCFASGFIGISLFPESHFVGLLLIGLAALFLVIKFVLVRKFAHLIRRSQPGSARSAALHR